MSIRRCLFALSAPLALLAALPAFCAGEAAPTPPTPLSTMSLSAMLLRATPLKTGVVLAVGADKLPLPADAVLPGDTPTVAAVGALYGQNVQPFGDVTALFPPTITVVYAPPETPNPYDGMPPGQIMQLLTKTFTAAQWKAFLSKDGVAYTAMTGDAQPALFGALFPGGHLKLIQDNPVGENDPKSKRDLSGDVLAAAHLRLGYTVSLALDNTTGGYVFANGLRPKDSPPRYFMTNAQDYDVDRELGATVRETIPNALKAGQMAYDDPALKAAVPLGGIQTVGDLVVRIGLTVKREIYADARYETRPVTLLPASGSAPAADLLRALAVCVGGTYRQVGPARVLTDDVIGLGTKHALWKAFEEKAAAMLPGGNDIFASVTLPPDAPYTVRDISANDDPLAFTPTQTDAFWKTWGQNPGESSIAMMDVTVPFDQLSPAQQDAAELIQAANEKSKFQTTLEGKVMVQAEPNVQILLPAVDGPILIFSSYKSLLPYPQPTAEQQKAQQQRMAQDFPDIAEPNAPPPPDFSQTLRGFVRRAARIAPKTPDETAQALTALKALGFTEVWLSVVPDSGETDAALKARLTQAVAAGRKSGLTVFADLSLLRWANADKNSLDLSLRGQPASPATVSPLAPAVAARLIAIERTLGGVPGLGGLVWESSPPPGYETRGSDTASDMGDTSLGYSQAGRLAFLRQAHADPVDLHDNSYTDKRAHVSVPGFDSDFNLERRLFTDWGKWRSDIFLALLGRLVVAPAQARLPLLMKPTNSTYSGSYGSWDDLRRPPPTIHYVSPTGPDGQPLLGVPSTEHLSSALVYTTVQTFLPPHPSDAQWKAAAARGLALAAKRGDKNVVLDLTGQAALWQETPKKETPKKA